MKQPERARPLYLESIRALEASQGKDSHMLARPYADLAALDLAAGNRAAAIAGYQHALALTGDDAHNAQFRADTEAALAKLTKH